MTDQVLIDGDMAIFQPVFGPAIVVVQPGRLAGSGPARIGGRPVCVEGDEARLSVPGCMYMTPQYSIPGTGTLKVARLAPDQLAQVGTSGGKALLLKGGQFTARFEVTQPAQQPPPGPGAPVPDATPSYSGQGRFMPANVTVRSG